MDLLLENALALAQFPAPSASVITIVVVLVALFFIIFGIWASRFTKVPPNTVMVISGGNGQTIRRQDGTRTKLGFRIIKGGGTFVLPILERVDLLSLELMTIDVKTPEVYTLQGVPVMVDGVAQIKVKSDDVSIATAVEQFLSKSTVDIMNVAQQTLEGHLRAIMGTMNVEEIYRNRDAFAQRVQDIAATDLANMGLAIISFTIRDVRDNEGYLDALGKKRTAEVKRDARIGEAEAERDATIKAASFRQEGETAKFQAETKIAESNRDYEIQVANYTKSVNKEKAEADLSYDLQKNLSMRQVRENEVDVEIVEKNKRIELANLEIERKQKELEATVQRPADAKKYETERIAEAERFRLENVAEGESRSKKLTGFAEAEVVQVQGESAANAAKAQGFAEAEMNQKKGEAEAAANKAQGLAKAEIERQQGLAVAEVTKAQGDAQANSERARGLAKAQVTQAQGEADGTAVQAKGLAEAEVIKQKGLAEAEGSLEKARAWQEYNEAAIAQLLIEALPEIVRAISEPMSRIDKITIVDSGGQAGTGAHKITQDIGRVLAELPPVVEALSGIDLKELISALPDIVKKHAGSTDSGNKNLTGPSAK
jgi:flotillin